MCGIAGLFGSGDRDLVEVMLSQLVHRGPDDGFIVYDDNFAMGARRLSILDLEGGRQPLSNQNSTVWAAQNGELYSYEDNRELLIKRQHRLITKCDTEILPHLYEEFGLDFVTHIDGMFAVSIWDKAKNIGILARDRLGKKPLYYLQLGENLYYASEIKALLQIPGFKRTVNLEALHHYLSFKHVPSPETIFEGIYSLPPAHYLVYKRGQEIKKIRYWDLSFKTDPELAKLDESSLVDIFVEKFRNGIKKRVVADVPIGFFLSGGLDSSLATAVAAETSDEPIKTFTLTYGGDSSTAGKDMDKTCARWVAKKYQTEHHEETVEFSQFPTNIRKIIKCFDQPFSGTVSTYFLAPLIRQNVTVAISGDGADEIFGSYLSHRLAIPLASLPEYQQNNSSTLLKPFDSESEVAYLKDLFEPDDWSWRAKLFVLSDQAKANLYSSSVAEQMKNFSSSQMMKETFMQLTATDPLNRILEAEYKSIFHDQVLAFVDRLSMAHSLEVRSAYLDTDVVEFIASLPGSVKIKNGETKYLLKQAALRYLPEEMVRRKKEGFIMPITDWLLRDLQEFVRETLSPNRLAAHGFFDSTKIRDIVDRIYKTQAHYTEVNKVYSLIVFQEWFELYIGNSQIVTQPMKVDSMRLDTSAAVLN
jgi:asparagine synthase (glutamine-hydrolysing)